MSAVRAPVLVLAVGNPSRGDDAIGPLLAERLEAAIREAYEEAAIIIAADHQGNPFCGDDRAAEGASQRDGQVEGGQAFGSGADDV